MRDNNQHRGRHSDNDFNQGPSGDYAQRRDDRDRDLQGGGYRERGMYRPESGLFEHNQPRLNQFERSNYGPSSGRAAGASRRHGPDEGQFSHGQDQNYDQYGGGYYGSDQFGEGADYSRGQQSGQRGDYGRGDDFGSDRSMRSRSADPGQSSYGGFTNEDTRYQRQQLGDYSRSHQYGGQGGHQGHQGHQGQREGGQDWQRNHGGHHGQSQGSQGQWQGGQGGQGQYGSEGQHGGGSVRRIAPKGYKRSDERLREDLCEQLSHSGLDVSEVSVEVSGGRVTLEGTVKDRRTKHAIEDRADECMGVQDVDNRIRVERDQSGPGSRSMSGRHSDTDEQNGGSSQSSSASQTGTGGQGGGAGDHNRASQRGTGGQSPGGLQSQTGAGDNDSKAGTSTGGAR